MGDGLDYFRGLNSLSDVYRHYISQRMFRWKVLADALMQEQRIQGYP